MSSHSLSRVYIFHNLFMEGNLAMSINIKNVRAIWPMNSISGQEFILKKLSPRCGKTHFLMDFATWFVIMKNWEHLYLHQHRTN